MTVYSYALRMRPPGPGCQPTDGLIRISSEPIYCFDKRCWGTAVYNRRLSDEDVNHYEMIYIGKFEE